MCIRDRDNYHRFISRLDSLDSQLTALFVPHTHHAFIIYHPALTYLARDYGLQQIALENEGKEPSAEHMRRIIDTARNLNPVSYTHLDVYKRQVQQIADIEKSVLRLLLTRQFLNIVDNQHVEHLVEVDEIIDLTRPHRIGKLGLEFVHRHIEYLHRRTALFRFHADRLRDMRLAKPRIPIYI